MEHKINCQCDDCIQQRTRDRVVQRDLDKARDDYEARRGAKIGSISISEALKGKKPAQ